MKEPLHLYPKHSDADAYKVGGFWSPYCLVSEDKRFADAELAAEVWRAKESCTFVGAFSGMPISPSNKLAKRLEVMPAPTFPPVKDRKTGSVTAKICTRNDAKNPEFPRIFDRIETAPRSACNTRRGLTRYLVLAERG